MIGPTTAGGNRVYLHIFRWPDRKASVACVKNKVLSAHILATGQEVKVAQQEDRVFLSDMPRKAPDPYDSVIAMELDGKPEGYPPDRFVP